MLNRICLIGSVWKEPRVLDLTCGFALVFPLATFDRQDGCPSPPHMISDWYHVVATDELGRICHDRLQCGDLVYLEGRVQSASIITENCGLDVATQSRCQVVADSVMILSDMVEGNCVVRET